MSAEKDILYLPQSFELLLKTYGNEMLLYHGASGDTLLLSPTAVSLIKRLQQGPLPHQALIEHVAEALNYEVDDDFIAHMDTVLSGLLKREIVAAK